LSRELFEATPNRPIGKCGVTFRVLDFDLGGTEPVWVFGQDRRDRFKLPGNAGLSYACH